MTKVIAAIVLVLYPLLMWAALQHASPRGIATLIIGMLLVAGAAAFARTHELLPLLVRRFAALLLLATIALAFDHPLALKLLPAFTHAWLLLTFASTLRTGPSLVEQFARASHGGEFPDFLVPYTRLVTAVWCVFFAINIVVYAWLAVAAPTDTWAFYTGFGCYLLLFAIAAAEYVFRKVSFRYYEDGWADRMWRRVLPPEGSKVGRRILAWQADRSPRKTY